MCSLIYLEPEKAMGIVIANVLHQRTYRLHVGGEKSLYNIVAQKVAQ